MASMFAMWARRAQIDTQSVTFSGNHYVNGLRHISASWWMKLVLNIVPSTAFPPWRLACYRNVTIS